MFAPRAKQPGKTRDLESRGRGAEQDRAQIVRGLLRRSTSDNGNGASRRRKLGQDGKKVERQRWMGGEEQYLERREAREPVPVRQTQAHPQAITHNECQPVGASLGRQTATPSAPPPRVERNREVREGGRQAGRKYGSSNRVALKVPLRRHCYS